MQEVLRVLLCFLWFFLSFLAYFFLHRNEGSIIVEIGYRSPFTEKHVISTNSTSFWDKLIYWNLCCNAKKNKREVWVFFGINLLACVATIVSFGILIWCLCKETAYDAFGIQIGWGFYSFLFLWCFHLFLDPALVPSERKRRGFKTKK